MLVISELKDMIAALRRDHENLGAKIDALQLIADCGDDPQKYSERISRMPEQDFEAHMQRRRTAGK